MDTSHLSDIKFADLPLLSDIQTAIHATGFEYCTPIQAETLPLTLKGKDVAGQAQTGTGKTAAFLLGMFQHLLKQPLKNKKPTDIRCLILAPTRELAIQIAKDAEVLSKVTGVRCALAYGGTGFNKQKKQIEQGADILIGTPGRIIDYWKQKVFSLKRCQGLILDEADRMFDLGFIGDIRFLLRRLPQPSLRLNMLFSATLSHRVLELAYEHMNSPTKIEIKAQAVNTKKIAQWIYYPANNEKVPLLLGLIRTLQPFRAIVFVNTKRNAELIDDYCRGNDIKAAMISGDVRQNKREKLLKQFEQGIFQLLIATDVAARGLHIDDISHVFNYDLPRIEEDYVHRIGRTGRAGASGEAHSFACEATAFYLSPIEKYIGMSIPMGSVPSDVMIDLKRPIKGARQSPTQHRKKPKGKRSFKPNTKAPYRKSSRSNSHQRKRNNPNKY
ncbi:MAG: DEAD/DEAH box helicase [Cocleimonas sp.]|nr:DEAD/DEAH box helicase [Cocleimonas sp.]